MSEPRWLDDLEMAAWQSFVEAGHRVDRALERQLKDEAGLSHPQYEILVHLSAASDGELRMAELAERLITSKSGITYQVAQLEKLGLVRRRQCPDQARGVFAVLTEQGSERLRAPRPRTWSGSAKSSSMCWIASNSRSWPRRWARSAGGCGHTTAADRTATEPARRGAPLPDEVSGAGRRSSQARSGTGQEMLTSST